MPGYAASPYAGDSDLPELIAFAQRLARTPYYHPGDLVWQLYAFDSSDDVRIWRDGEQIVACAIFEPPLTFQFGISPTIVDQGALADEVLTWVEGRRALVENKQRISLAYRQLGSDTLCTSALDGDAQRIDALARSGYERRGPSAVRFARELALPLPEVVIPDGARFRRIDDGDVDARAELHRDAWSVWGPSSHSSARYRRLRAAPLYDAELDVVLEIDGQLVSYCLCWLDAVNRVGYFEPVGTRPSATGRGFGRAVIREGMRRLRERGMIVATVSTAQVNEPAQALYASAGFKVTGEEHFYVKRDSAAGA